MKEAGTATTVESGTLRILGFCTSIQLHNMPNEMGTVLGWHGFGHFLSIRFLSECEVFRGWEWEGAVRYFSYFNVVCSCCILFRTQNCSKQFMLLSCSGLTLFLNVVYLIICLQ
jgi:hypothetical protein